MNLICRILWFVLIFQILALSAIPPAIAGCDLHVGKTEFNKQIRKGQDTGLPGQFGGFVKGEQDVVSEDDTEDFPQAHDGWIGVIHGLKPFLADLHVGKIITKIAPIPSGVALFIRFHCWKLDICID